MASTFLKFDAHLQSSTGITILYQFIISKEVTCDTNFFVLAFKRDFNANLYI